jgi:hypothetical protein
MLVNHARWFRRSWEHYLCFINGGKDMLFWFEADKEDKAG